MEPLPATWLALCALALVLGIRHGFDADHLATIDGLTRYNARANPRLSRSVGALFSLGHGVVVIFVALIAGSLATGWQTPAWLEITGASVSVVFLFGLAFLNVRAVLTADPRAVVATAGVRARLLGRFLNIRRAWAVTAVGMLFALSFDTVSQAALFALAAGRFGGLSHALFVAGLFVLGMLAVDGANGLWINRLIRKADRTAAIASRVMALTVAGISLAVGAFTIAKILLPAVDALTEGRELWLGAVVVFTVLLGFVAAMCLARRRVAVART
ncbi:MAG: nickel transporter [Casimicrobiaceae bacterium]